MVKDETTLHVGDRLIDSKRREFTITRIGKVETDMDSYKIFYTDRTPPKGVKEDYFCEDDREWSTYQVVLALRKDPEKKKFIVTCAGGYPVVSDMYDERTGDYRQYALIIHGKPKWMKSNRHLLRQHEVNEIMELCRKHKD